MNECAVLRAYDALTRTNAATPPPSCSLLYFCAGHRQVSDLDDSAAFADPHHPGAHADICVACRLAWLGLLRSSPWRAYEIKAKQRLDIHRVQALEALRRRTGVMVAGLQGKGSTGVLYCLLACLSVDLFMVPS